MERHPDPGHSRNVRGPIISGYVQVSAPGAAGADLFAWGNANLRVSYDGCFADDTEIHGGSARGRLEF